MAREPSIGKFIDDEERELYEAIEAEDYVPQSIMTDEMVEELRASARYTMALHNIKKHQTITENSEGREGKIGKQKQ